MAETNAQRKRRRIIPDTLAELDQPAQPAPLTEASSGLAEDTRSEFGKGLASGVRTVESIGQSLVGAGAAALGADEFAERRIAASQQAQQQAGRVGPRVTRVEDITNFEDAADFVAGVAGQQLPILATTFGGGAAGLAGRKLIPGAARAVSAPTAGAVGAVGTGIGLETGSIFGDIASDPEARKNRTLREIAGISAVGGTAAGSLEALPIISAFRRFGLGKSATRAIRSSLAKRVGKGAGAQALLEGGTEGAQTIIERSAAKFANENREVFGEEGFSEILNAIAAGVIIGGPTGAVSGGFQLGGDTKGQLEKDQQSFNEREAVVRARQDEQQQKRDDGIEFDEDEGGISVGEELEDLQGEAFALDQRREALGIAEAEFEAGFRPGPQQGSLEDELDIEESLDELETTGGFSSEIDDDLTKLGPVGVDIRAARSLASETELEADPASVVLRILKRTAEDGGALPTFRSFGQLVQAVGNLENTAQLDNIIAESGIDPEIRVQLRDALLQKNEDQDVAFIERAVEDVPEAKGGGRQDPRFVFGFDPDVGPSARKGFQSPNVSRTHIFRNKNGKLGFVPSNDPKKENALRNTLAGLESDFPDIVFGVDGLGDALFDSLPAATKNDPDKARASLLRVANEKLNEAGFNAPRFASLDPAKPREFLNQFKAIRKEEVDVSLSGRDEFRLTDSDLLGPPKRATTELGGPVTKPAVTAEVRKLAKEEQKLRRALRKAETSVGRQVAQDQLDIVVRKKQREIAKQSVRPRVGPSGATITQKQSRPIFVLRKKGLKEGDFNVNRKGRPQTVDAIALTNKMLTKQNLQKSPSAGEIGNAFFTGLTALVQRGVTLSANDASSTQLELFPEFNIPDDLVIHKGRGANGKITTYGEVRKSGSGRIRARIQAYKHQQIRIEAQIKDIGVKLNKPLPNGRTISPKAKRDMERLQKKLKRRIEKVPTEIETLLVFGKSVSRDVKELTKNLEEAATTLDRQNNAAELMQLTEDKDVLAVALAEEADGLSDIAEEVQSLRRQLEREEFNTQATEELSGIGDQLDRLETFATETQRAARSRGAREGELNQEDVAFPTINEVMFAAHFSRNGKGLNDIAKLGTFTEQMIENDRAINAQMELLPPGASVTFNSVGDPVIEGAPKAFMDEIARLRAREEAISRKILDTRAVADLRIEDTATKFTTKEFDRIADKLNINNAALVAGDDIPFTLSNLGLDELKGQMIEGSMGGVTITRQRNLDQILELLQLQEEFRKMPPSILLGIARATLEAHNKVFGPMGDNVDFIVMVNPFMSKESLIAELLGHEMGHVVFKTRFNNAPAAVQDAIREDFNNWRKEVGRFDNTTVGAVFASKRGFEFALDGMLGAGVANLSETSSEGYNYLFDFEEWFADQTSRWLVAPPSQPEQKSVVDEFFKGVADAIRELWDTFIEQFGFEPAPSVAAFLEDMVHANPDAELSLAKTQMVNAAKKIGIDTDNKGIAAVFQLMDPFSENTNYSMREVMRDNLEPEERKTVFKYFNRRSVKARLKKLLTDPRQQEMVDSSPLHAAAYGYQMWVAGTFELTSPSEEVQAQGEAVVRAPKLVSLVANIFRGLFDVISARLGFVYESEQTEQILEAIRSGTIDARKAGRGEFSVIKAVRGDLLRNIAQAGNDAFRHIAPFFDKMLTVADTRMLDSGVPALVQIAKAFHARTGSENQPKTFFEARREQIGGFMNSYTRITTDLQKDPELKAEVLGLLRNPGKQGSKEAIIRASAVRKLLRRIRNYMSENGLEVGDRGKDYFPWVFDARKIQDNSDFFRGLLNDKRFAPNMAGILNNINQRIRDDNTARKNLGGAAKFEEPRPEITKDELIERMMMGLEQSEGLADTNLNPERSGTVPFFGAMNKRTLGFLTKEKGGLTAAERQKFDGMFSDQLDLTMMTYIRQAVKRTEYVKRFGFDSGRLTDLLDEAREEGASDADMRTAHTYIDAMTGVIGEETNNRVAKLLGLGPREGEVINPHWRTFTSIAMVLQNLAVLPLATFTSLVDPVGILVRSQDLKATMAALRTGASEIVAEVRLLAGGDEKKIRSELRQLAEGMGTIEDHMTNEALEWEYGSTYLTPRLKATNEFFFKAIGLTQWTRVTRLMALAGGKEFIKRHVKRPNGNSDRFLDQLGIKAEDVRFDKDGDLLILSRNQREGDNKLGPVELARDNRVRNALNRFVDESILRPNAAQRPIWASDPNYALVFHLKSFMFSFHDRILRRASQEAEFGNTVPLMLLAVFIPAMLFADVLRDLLQFGTGGNPRKAKWGLEDHMWNATQRSGLNGIGQLLIDAQQDVQFGGLGYESLAGPTVDGITDLGGLFSDDDQAQWNAFTRNLPGSSAWKHWLENGLDDS